MMVERFTDRIKNINFTVLTFILILNIFHPFQLLNPETIEKIFGNTLFVTNKEDYLNCRITLKFKTKNRFIEEKSCFKKEKIEGIYEMRGDTIYFQYNNETIKGIKKAFAILTYNNRSNATVAENLIMYKDNDNKTLNVFHIKKWYLQR